MIGSLEVLWEFIVCSVSQMLNNAVMSQSSIARLCQSMAGAMSTISLVDTLDPTTYHISPPECTGWQHQGCSGWQGQGCCRSHCHVLQPHECSGLHNHLMSHISPPRVLWMTESGVLWMASLGVLWMTYPKEICSGMHFGLLESALTSTLDYVKYGNKYIWNSAKYYMIANYWPSFRMYHIHVIDTTVTPEWQL